MNTLLLIAGIVTLSRQLQINSVMKYLTNDYK